MRNQSSRSIDDVRGRAPSATARPGTARWSARSRTPLLTLRVQRALPAPPALRAWTALTALLALTALTAVTVPATASASPRQATADQPSATELQASLQAQLVPPDPALTIGIGLESGGYSLPFRVITPGRVQINWYLGAPADPSSAPLVASGATRFYRVHESQVTIDATRRGRDLVRHARSLALTAVATFTPSDGGPVQADARFRLS